MLMYVDKHVVRKRVIFPSKVKFISTVFRFVLHLWNFIKFPPYFFYRKHITTAWFVMITHYYLYVIQHAVICIVIHVFSNYLILNISGINMMLPFSSAVP